MNHMYQYRQNGTTATVYKLDDFYTVTIMHGGQSFTEYFTSLGAAYLFIDNVFVEAA